MSYMLSESNISLQATFPKPIVAVEVLELFHIEELPNMILGQELTEYLGRFSWTLRKTAWSLP
jgi:hypothetical protein